MFIKKFKDMGKNNFLFMQKKHVIYDLKYLFTKDQVFEIVKFIYLFGYNEKVSF